MVDGNEEVDAILFEFNVSAVLLLFAAVCSCSVMCFLDLGKDLLSGDGPGLQKLSGNMADPLALSYGSYNDKRLCIVKVTPQVFA